MRWILERSREIHAERAPDVLAKVHLYGYPDNLGQIELIESHGFTAVNWSAVMRVRLDDGRELAAARLPSGFTLLPYDLSWSARMRAAHNAAFLDHWGFVPWDEQMWQQWIDGSKNFRPDISWVVVDDADPEVVVAYVQSNEFDAYEAMTGRREAYLGKIGVRREYRGRGLASALLRHALRGYRDAGYVESSLDVDTNNPTGAFGLYERAGFEVEKRMTIYEIEFPASGGARAEVGDAFPNKRGGMNMSGERAAAFRRLHSSGCFVMPNPWDAGSARALEQLGFKALATTSAGFAWTLGLRGRSTSGWRRRSSISG